MKIITLCGSLKFKKEMMEIAEKMALLGNCILTPIYPIIENVERTEEQLAKLKEEHFKRIELSNSIRVKNNLSEQDTDKFLSLTRTPRRSASGSVARTRSASTSLASFSPSSNASAASGFG